jgi:hypothetical protein
VASSKQARLCWGSKLGEREGGTIARAAVAGITGWRPCWNEHVCVSFRGRAAVIRGMARVVYLNQPPGAAKGADFVKGPRLGGGGGRHALHTLHAQGKRGGTEGSRYQYGVAPGRA